MSSRNLPPLWAERLSITATRSDESFGASIRSTYASNAALVVLPTTAMHGPIPSEVMLAKGVTFFPRLRGALHRARSPLRPGVQRGQGDVRAHLVHKHQPRGVYCPDDTSAPSGPQELVALSRSYRSFFRLDPSPPSIRETVESLTETPATQPRNSRLCGSVAVGRSLRSTFRSLLAASSIFGLEPGRFFGSSERPSRALVA